MSNGSEIKKGKKEIIKAGKKTAKKDLTIGPTGNISRRIDKNHFLITRSGANLGALKEHDILLVGHELNFKKEAKHANYLPSTEFYLHSEIYKKRNDVNAIVHAHPKFSCAFAVAGKKIPSLLEETAYFIKGEIEVAPYAEPGSRELGKNAAKTLKDKNAVLLKSHGIVCAGKNLEETLLACEVAERSAEIAIYAGILKSATI